MGQRKKPKKEDIRKLFNNAGNKCAFLECNHPLIDEEDNLFIGQICHIESPKERGPRYNTNTDENYKRSYENLILLCYRHHRRVDKFVDQYPIELLKKIKKDHEKNHIETYKIKEEILDDVYSEINAYWNEIETLNTIQHFLQEHAMKINTDLETQLLHKECINSFSHLQKILRACDEYMDNNWNDIIQFLIKHQVDTTKIEHLDYLQNPFINPLWDCRKLGLNNWVQRFKLDFMTLIIKALEYESIHNPSNNEVKQYLGYLRKELREVADKVCHVD